METDSRRIANGKTDAAAVARVSRHVRNFFTAISIGLARFDAFGRLGFVARIGLEPTVEIDNAMQQKFDLSQ